MYFVGSFLPIKYSGMAAYAKHKSVKDPSMELIEGKIQDLEKKCLLPKGKN